MDLTNAIRAIQDRTPAYTMAEAYYEGTVKEVMSGNLRGLVNNHYKVNFCRTVVDSVLDRLELNAITAIGDANEAQQAAIGQTFQDNELDLEADEIHRRALVYGDCYAIVWPDDEGNVEVSYNSPLNTVLMYDPEHPRRKSYAAKVWASSVDGLGQPKGFRANLYYADRVEKYSSNATMLDEHTRWSLTDTVENPFGQVPVFHFRTERPYGRPEHHDTYGMQDAITKLVANHLYTIEYQAAPQRYALTHPDAPEVQDFNDGDTDRENARALQASPGNVWFLKGVESVGQFASADPKAFLEPMQAFVRAMASLSQTPLHYFERTGNVPSGEALRTAEAPLLKKVNDRQQAFGSAWRELFNFVLEIEGLEGDVQVKWESIESMDSKDYWDVLLKKRNAGVPMRQVFAEAGYDTDLVEQMLTWFEQERETMGGFIQRDPVVKVREAVEEPVG